MAVPVRARRPQLGALPRLRGRRVVSPFVQAAGHVTSVVLADDMVPRFGVASTLDLRDSLAALHSEPGLLGRIHSLREAQRQRRAQRELGGGSASSEENETADEVDVAVSRSLLEWLRRTVALRPKLYPPGLVLHTTDGATSSWTVGADPSSFGVLRLSETMGSSHLPQSYAQALLGDCPVAPSAGGCCHHVGEPCP